MKKYKDKIEKVAELVSSNAITKHQGEWRFIDKNLNLSYRITRFSCECMDYQIHSSKPSEAHYICKHIFLLCAPQIALFIVEIRKAESLKDVQIILERWASAIKLALPEFERLAENEYNAALARIQSQPEETIAESVNVPEKPAKAQRSYASKTINKAGENLVIAGIKEAPMSYGSIEII